MLIRHALRLVDTEQTKPSGKRNFFKYSRNGCFVRNTRLFIAMFPGNQSHQLVGTVIIHSLIITLGQ